MFRIFIKRISHKRYDKLLVRRPPWMHFWNRKIRQAESKCGVGGFATDGGSALGPVESAPLHEWQGILDREECAAGIDIEGFVKQQASVP
jgi:hypothetical protein